MLRIMGKLIDLDKSPLLLSEAFAGTDLPHGWTVYGGKWRIEDEWLTGKNPENCPGMIVSTRDFVGNVLLEFEARTVVPSTHDIDAMWNGSWDEAANQRGIAYVAGIEGWWDGKVGIEKSPGYKLTACTPLFDFDPGAVYRVQCGSVDGHCFIFIDGKLALEVTDPEPIDSARYARIGFEAYCSHIQIRKLIVRQIVWRAEKRQYSPEF